MFLSTANENPYAKLFFLKPNFRPIFTSYRADTLSHSPHPWKALHFDLNQHRDRSSALVASDPQKYSERTTVAVSHHRVETGRSMALQDRNLCVPSGERLQHSRLGRYGSP